MYFFPNIPTGSGQEWLVTNPLADKPTPDYVPHFLRIVNVDIIGPVTTPKPI
jgi:hypothetical protein